MKRDKSCIEVRDRILMVDWFPVELRVVDELDQEQIVSVLRDSYWMKRSGVCVFELCC